MSRRPALLAVATTGVALAVLAAPALAVAAPGNPGSPRYGAGADGAGDPYFPLAGNGGIDVLHYDLDLDYTPAPPAPAPDRGSSRRRRHDRPRRDAGPRPLQPRPARAHRVAGDGRRQVDGVRADRERARHHAPPEAQGRRADAGRRHLRRHDDPTDRHRGGAVRLGHHTRWCDGRERARRVGHVVPRQRPPDRQVDVLVRDHRARGPRRGGERIAGRRTGHRRRYGRPGTGTHPTRWPPTSRRRASATTW